jgi:hypothetical protein
MLPGMNYSSRLLTEPAQVIITIGVDHAMP